MAEIRVKEICKERGITLQELASQLGITQPALTQRLNNPTLRTIEEIANALNVSVNELIRDDRDASVIRCPKCGYELKVTIE